MIKKFFSHGSGEIESTSFARLGDNVIFEAGSMVFHADHIEIGDNVYVGHHAILKGYYRNRMIIGNNVWIGQQTFLHSAGGLTIGDNVGIGPGVKIHTSRHAEVGRGSPIMSGALQELPVIIEADADLGVGSLILPGVRVGRGAQIGAGAVVTHDVPDFAVAVGVPARVVRYRGQ